MQAKKELHYAKNWRISIRWRNKPPGDNRCVKSRNYYKCFNRDSYPALIPAFCGKGFYGLHVHEEVLKRGVKLTGATVHFVDEGTDTGPIILQKAVEVKNDDTPEILQRRVMEEAEWKIMPEAINLIANGKVSIKDNKVIISE